MRPLGDYGGTLERGPKARLVTDRPVGVYRQHHRIGTSAAVDLTRPPRERAASAHGARFRNDILRRHVRQMCLDRIPERRVRQDERSRGRDQWFQALDRSDQERTIIDEREELFRSRRRAEWPEARPHATGQHHGPSVHGCSAPCSS
jgi:hypothetical protein